MQAEEPPGRSNATAKNAISSPQAIPGHEGFAQPSTYLRPRGHSRPMTPAPPERPVDRDERQGLVSGLFLS
jgi:5'-AMP-activated protein kinase, regulatory gamma subunit